MAEPVLQDRDNSELTNDPRPARSASSSAALRWRTGNRADRCGRARKGAARTRGPFERGGTQPRNTPAM
jgi:hypothetical protein